MMITDRTQADVINVPVGSTTPSKGAYNYTDLNRVEAKVKELNDILVEEKYMSQLTTKLDWTMTDIFKQSDATRYLNNVKAIRNALAVKPTTPQVPTSMNKLTYTKANNIEKILVDIEDIVLGLRNWFVYSNVSRSGQNRLWQNRFRHFYGIVGENQLMTEQGQGLLTEASEELDCEVFTPTQIEYLQSTGTQYIDTGIKTGLNIAIECEMAYDYAESVTSWNGCVYGGNAGWIAFGDYSLGSLASYFCYGSRNGCTITKDTNFHVYYVSNGLQKIDSTQTTISATSMSTTMNIYLFGGNNDWGEYIRNSQKIKYCKIWDNGTLVRDYIPVLNVNGEACLYDRANDTYNYSASQSSFLPPQPTTFTKLDYIQSSGTQYINTGLNATPSTMVLTRFYVVSRASQNGFFGNFTGDTNYLSYGLYNNGSNYYAVHYKDGTGQGFQTQTCSASQVVNVQFNERNNFRIKINSGSVNSYSLASYTATKETLGKLKVFTYTWGEETGTSNAFSSIRLYKFAIVQNGEILQDLVPVKRTSDNVVCLYDLVSHQFFENAGTGDFIEPA